MTVNRLLVETEVVQVALAIDVTRQNFLLHVRSHL